MGWGTKLFSVFARNEMAEMFKICREKSRPLAKDAGGMTLFERRQRSEAPGRLLKQRRREIQRIPREAKVVREQQPRATPRMMPARTSLRKCIPRTMRERAMLSARKISGNSRLG